MKIAIAAPTEIPARRANTFQVMKMAQALADTGNIVRLAAPIAFQGQAVSWEALARHYGLRSVFPVDWLKAEPRLRRYDYGWRAVRWARSWGADLFYTRLPQAAALASFWGMPTIFEVHDLVQGTVGPWLLRRFLQGKGARRLVVITRALAEDLAEVLGVPLPGSSYQADLGMTLIAPDGVDLFRYHNLPDPQTARAGLQPELPERFTVGYTGHLYTGRGAEMLLELARRLTEITFLLVGGEPTRVSSLSEQVRAAGLTNVILTGFVLNADLPRYQAACDVLLMPYQTRVAASSGGDISRYLSPMKLFEYMACGRAILSSDLPVLREVLNPDNAVLLPPDDIDTWAVEITALAADLRRRLRLGAQARRDVAAYTWEARAEKILEGI